MPSEVILRGMLVLFPMGGEELLHHPVSQGHQCEACYQACRHISGKATDVAVLKHLHAFVGKGGEGRETSAEPCGEQHAPRMGGRAVLAEKCEYEAENKASEQVDRQRAPGESRPASVLHQRGDGVPQCAPNEAPDADDEYGLYHNECTFVFRMNN